MYHTSFHIYKLKFTLLALGQAWGHLAFFPSVCHTQCGSDFVSVPVRVWWILFSLTSTACTCLMLGELYCQRGLSLNTLCCHDDELSCLWFSSLYYSPSLQLWWEVLAVWQKSSLTALVFVQMKPNHHGVCLNLQKNLVFFFIFMHALVS